jgi:hypothetical protein
MDIGNYARTTLSHNPILVPGWLIHYPAAQVNNLQFVCDSQPKPQSVGYAAAGWHFPV